MPRWLKQFMCGHPCVHDLAFETFHRVSPHCARQSYAAVAVQCCQCGKRGWSWQQPMKERPLRWQGSL